MSTYVGNSRPNNHVGFEAEMLGKKGDDNLRYAGNDDATLYGQRGSDFLGGNFGNDVLRGGRGQDTLFGDAGDDALYGGRGRDTLIGDYGENWLCGGKGKDTFTFFPTLAGKTEIDHIMDYQIGKDRVALGGWVGVPDYDPSTGLITVTDQNGDIVDVAVVESRPDHVDFSAYVPPLPL